MDKKLTDAEALAVNQKMISEWAERCKANNLLAFFMVTITPENNIKFFASEGMDSAAIVRHLRFMANEIEKRK